VGNQRSFAERVARQPRRRLYREVEIGACGRPHYEMPSKRTRSTAARSCPPRTATLSISRKAHGKFRRRSNDTGIKIRDLVERAAEWIELASADQLLPNRGGGR